MSVVLRRLLILLILAGAAATSRRLIRRERSAESPAQWPPFAGTAESTVAPSDPPPTGDGDTGTETNTAINTATATTTPTATAATTTVAAPGDWAEPNGNSCPADAPIKAKTRSGIYHVPGGRFYDRTAPDRCYRSEAAAQADGYRRSSN